MANVIQINLNKILAGTPFEKERTIGVALSGGRDSIALCHALKEAGEKIVAINVEHGIRGENSLKDTEFVKEFCNKEGIKLYCESVDAPGFAKECGFTIEQAARILRYIVFENAVHAGKCDLIALAHHSGDQAETILMRILRGTGVKGLVGMQKLSGRYIRPLLDYSREDIDAYVKQHNLAYVDDETNADLTYTRNFLRAEIARLKERYPDLENSFARLSRNALETEEYLQEILPELEVKDGEVLIETDSLNPFVLKMLVIKAAKMLGVRQDIEEKHLAAVVELARNENGKKLNFAHGLVAHKDEKGIVLAQEKSAECKEEPFAVGRHEDLGVLVESVKSVDEDELKSGQAQFVDIDKLPAECVLRARKEGDYIKKFGGGTKNVGDFLTDKKVPARKRDSLVVVAKGCEVFVVVGVDVSREVKIDENTKNIGKITRL